MTLTNNTAGWDLDDPDVLWKVTLQPHLVQSETRASSRVNLGLPVAFQDDDDNDEDEDEDDEEKEDGLDYNTCPTG